jgi:hypothetical protein
VLGDLSGCGGFVGVGDVSLAQSDPRIGPLSSNGGKTLTVPLLAGSAAIDHTTSCPASDQRGVTRPQGSACDTGAFELVPPAAPPTAVTPTPTATLPAKKCRKGFKLVKKKGKKKCKRKKRKRR